MPYITDLDLEISQYWLNIIVHSIHHTGKYINFPQLVQFHGTGIWDSLQGQM